MELNSLKKLYLSNYFILNFQTIKEDEIFSSYLLFLKSLIQKEDIEEILKNYQSFILKLKNKDLGSYIKEKLIKISVFKENIQNELDILNNLLKINFNDIKHILKEEYKNLSDIFDSMPEFKNTGLNLKINDITEKDKEISDDIYKNNQTFIFDNDLILKPVENNETISFKDLKGYKKQQKILYQNTKSLLENKKVNNILLYGDAGCGKSSSVRALLNEFKEIKIVQIFKNNLINLDKLYTILKKLPYKFIIFADDISFKQDDESFSTMKAILEGSIIQCPKNAVIYATSNRRHLVRESFSSRQGDEIHLNDTINEINSLSERFGINLLFQKPSNEEFNAIVLELAKDNNININETLLLEKAQRLALIKGSRSPRVAKQLIDNLTADIDI